MRVTNEQAEAITEAEEKVADLLKREFPGTGVTPASTFLYAVWKLPNYQRLALAETILQRPLTKSKK